MPTWEDAQSWMDDNKLADPYVSFTRGSVFPSRGIDATAGGNYSQADFEGRLRLKKLQNALDQEDALASKIAAEDEESRSKIPTPQDEQLAARKRDLDYERLLPAGEVSHAVGGLSPEGPSEDVSAFGRTLKGHGGMLSEPEQPGYLRRIMGDSGERLIGTRRELGGPTAGEMTTQALREQPTYELDAVVHDIQMRGRELKKSPQEIEQAITDYLKQRTLHGAIGKRDYATAERALFPTDPLKELQAEMYRTPPPVTQR